MTQQQQTEARITEIKMQYHAPHFCDTFTSESFAPLVEQPADFQALANSFDVGELIADFYQQVWETQDPHRLIDALRSIADVAANTELLDSQLLEAWVLCDKLKSMLREQYLRQDR